MPKIILDAAHGGEDPGPSYENRMAKDDNLRLVLAVGDILEQYNYEVFYTRTEDVDIALNERLEMVNQEGGDLLLSLTRNSAAQPNTLSGVEAIIYRDNNIEEIIATNINTNLQDVGFQSLGILQFYTPTPLFTESNIPVILELVGFINSIYDNVIFDTRFNEVASAIAYGIIEYWGEQNASLY
jgi:N-acetylmuramoyl-L-alanine amidase